MTAERGAPPRIAVVVLNWRGARDTEHCLDSILRADPRPACVVVVENGSGDDSRTRLDAWCRTRVDPYALRTGAEAAAHGADDPLPWLTLLALDENRGFAGGNNAALRLLHAHGGLTHFLLLNNDTEVAPDYFAALARAVRARPDAAILSGTIYHFDDRSHVWWAGGVERPLRALVLHRTERPASDAVVDTEFVTGCAMLISRPALDRLGGLPECYFPAYGEDAEYSHRARRAGLAVLYAPAPTVFHRVGAATRARDLALLPTMLGVRHRAFFVRRNLRGASRAAALAYLAVTKPGRALVELLRGRPALAGAVWRGAVSGLLSPAAHAASPSLRAAPPAAARTRSS